MTFADMVLAHGLLNLLDDHQIDLLLDDLAGDPAHFTLHDLRAITTFARELRSTYGDGHPVARAIDSVLAHPNRQTTIHCTTALVA